MRTLRVTCWNVNGLYKRSQDYCKLEDESFKDAVNSYDIIGLVETHTGPDDDISLEGFSTSQINRPKNKKANKFSGGLAILIKNDIKKGTRIIQAGMSSIWLKLDKHFFGHPKDIYVCIAYLPPENSSYSRSSNKDCIEDLEKQVQHFSPLGDLLILGDLNARTAREPDYIINDTARFVPNSLGYKADTVPPDRLNQDVNTNERGRKLLDMCVSTGLRILNGRKPGDTMGYLTCHKYNGSSMVDYGLVNEELFNDILYFHVHKSLSHISDHCQISLCIHNLQIA
jgi:exonuclease III